MKKKNIAFILWGVAASNFISIPVTLVLMPRLYERMGMPTTAAANRYHYFSCSWAHCDYWTLLCGINRLFKIQK